MRRLPKISPEEMAEIREAVPMKGQRGLVKHRREAGLKGRSYGDCVTRAIQNYLGTSYADAREALQEAQAGFAKRPVEGRSRAAFWATVSAQQKGGKVQGGVHKQVYAPLLESLGLAYQDTPTHRTTVAEPCMPPDAIVEMPRHLVAKVKGEIVDTWDSRSRRVEGFWYDPSCFSVDYDNGSWQAVEEGKK